MAGKGVGVPVRTGTRQNDVIGLAGGQDFVVGVQNFEPLPEYFTLNICLIYIKL
jgi:hypothetical protein